MTEELSREIAAWLRPAIASIDSNSLARYQEAIQSIAEKGVGQDIVAVAFGVKVPIAIDRLENSLEDVDETYVRGESSVLLGCIAGSATMLALRKGVTSTAHLVESARFLGHKEKVKGLGFAAQQLVDGNSRGARSRVKFAPATIKRLVNDEVAQPEIVSTVNLLIKRMEDTVASTNRRLTQMDEEIDVLWWGRSSTSFTNGQAWATMTDLDRALVAGAELNGLLKYDPPFQGALSILRDKAGVSKEEVDIASIGVAARDGLLAENHRGPLLPLSSAAGTAREYDADKKVMSAVLKKEQIDTKTRVKVADIAAQVLRELAIGRTL